MHLQSTSHKFKYRNLLWKINSLWHFFQLTKKELCIQPIILLQLLFLIFTIQDRIPHIRTTNDQISTIILKGKKKREYWQSASQIRILQFFSCNMSWQQDRNWVAEYWKARIGHSYSYVLSRFGNTIHITIHIRITIQSHLHSHISVLQPIVMLLSKLKVNKIHLLNLSQDQDSYCTTSSKS